LGKRQRYPSSLSPALFASQSDSVVKQQSWAICRNGTDGEEIDDSSTQDRGSGWVGSSP
jgi:hypothetical protein